LARQAAGPLAP